MTHRLPQHRFVPERGAAPTEPEPQLHQDSQASDSRDRQDRLRRRMRETLDRFVRWEKAQRGVAQGGALAGMGYVDAAVGLEVHEPARHPDRWRQWHLSRERRHAFPGARLTNALALLVDADGGDADAPRRASLGRRSPTSVKNRRLWLSILSQIESHTSGCYHQTHAQGLHPERAPSRNPGAATPPPASEMRCCRPSTLGAGGRGRFLRSQGGRRKVERLGDVLRFEVRIEIEDVARRKPTRHHIEHDRDWDSKPTNARSPAELIRLHGNTVEDHELATLAQHVYDVRCDSVTRHPWWHAGCSTK